VSQLEHARSLVTAMQDAVDRAATHLAARCEEDGRISTGLVDEHHTVAYDLASVASAVAAAQHLLGYGE
jgi:(2S)-methylsuccinyl-CoA dehydrogenase